MFDGDDIAVAPATHTQFDAKPQNTHRNLWPVVGWPWCCVVGNRERVAHPAKRIIDAKVIVFWEHIFILIMFLPILISRLDEIPRVRARTWGFLIFSGFAGSAVGTVFFTLALKYGNPTVVNVVLNIQPVISTLGAFLLFGDRLARQFFLYAGIAIVAGVFVSVAYPTQIGVSFERAGLNVGTGMR